MIGLFTFSGRTTSCWCEQFRLCLSFPWEMLLLFLLLFLLKMCRRFNNTDWAFEAPNDDGPDTKLSESPIFCLFSPSSLRGLTIVVAASQSRIKINIFCSFILYRFWKIWGEVFCSSIDGERERDYGGFLRLKCLNACETTECVCQERERENCGTERRKEKSLERQRE